MLLFYIYDIYVVLGLRQKQEDIIEKSILTGEIRLIKKPNL